MRIQHGIFQPALSTAGVGKSGTSQGNGAPGCRWLLRGPRGLACVRLLVLRAKANGPSEGRPTSKNEEEAKENGQGREVGLLLWPLPNRSPAVFIEGGGVTCPRESGREAGRHLGPLLNQTIETAFPNQTDHEPTTTPVRERRRSSHETWF